MTSVKSVAVLAATTFLTTTAVFADGHVDRTGWPDSFTVGTASQGGTFFAYGSGWANLVAEELGVSGGAEVTGGPMQNMALVHTGEAQFGMTTMGPAAESLAGTNPGAPGIQMTGACAMFPMYQTPFSITTLASSGITSISEIPAGARIGFGPAGSSSDTYFPAMLTDLGIEYDRRNGGWDDLGSQLQDGLLDVIAFAAGVPVPAVSQLEVQTDINIIEFTPWPRSTSQRAPTRRWRKTRTRSRCGTSPSPIATFPKASSTKPSTSSCPIMTGCWASTPPRAKPCPRTGTRTPS